MKASVTTDTTTSLFLTMESALEKEFIISQLNFAKDNNTTLNDEQKKALDQLASRISAGVNP